MGETPPTLRHLHLCLLIYLVRSRTQQQVKRRIVWVRLTTGSGSLGPSSVISSSGIALCQIMLQAPGDVATLRTGVIESYASTLVGLVETDLRVSIGGHVLEDNDSIDEYGAERGAPFDVHLAAERATEQVHGPLAGHAPPPDLQSAPRDSRVCSPLTNCHAPNARRLSEVIIAGQNRRHGRRSRSGSRPRCGSPARRLRESQQMDSASRGGCRLAARQTVRASLFSRPPRRRGGAGSMASCSTPATCCGNIARARATVQVTKSSLTDGHNDLTRVCIIGRMVGLVRKGGDTTTRTEVETAGSGKDLGVSGFGPWPAGRCKGQSSTLDATDAVLSLVPWCGVFSSNVPQVA